MSEAGASLTGRMVGAALLRNETYDAVEADPSATGQAALVVVIVAVCAAIGAAGIGLATAIASALAALVGWLIWAGITYVIGDKIFGGTATWGELLRTLGFAQAPGVLYILGVLPVIGALTSVVVSIWILIAGFIGIRQALDIGNGKTFLTVLIGGLIYAVLQNVSL